MASFATSYIPTGASQTTRAADVATIQGSNFYSWYNQNEGSVFAQSTFNGATAFLQRIGLCISDGTSNNRITSLISSGTAIRTIISSAGTAQADISTTISSTFNTAIKNATAYKANDFANTVNNATVQTDTAGITPIVNQAWIGQTEAGGSSLMLNGTIKQISYYPQKLSDSVLKGLTA